MTPKVEQLAAKIAGLTGPGEKEAALYYVCARGAAGIENNEEGTANFPYNMGEMWAAAEGWMDEAAKVDPKLAFEQALNICLLPRNPNEEQEKVNKWIRGDGPLCLAKDSLRQTLIDFVGSDKRAPGLFVKLGEYLNFDMSKIKSSADAFSDADCFLAVATMYLGAKLGETRGNRWIASLATAAKEKLADPKISQIVKYYSTEPDTAWIVQELTPFLVP